MCPWDWQKVDHWLKFWREVVIAKSIDRAIPAYSTDLVRWIFRILYDDELLGKSARPKFQGQVRKRNDRLAIGLPPKGSNIHVTQVAFSLWPSRVNREMGAQKGDLCFLLYALNAGGKKRDDGLLKKWLTAHKVSTELSRCIFPNDRPYRNDGRLDLDVPFNRYAQMLLLREGGFDGKWFRVIGRGADGKADFRKPVVVGANDIKALLLSQVYNRPKLKVGA